MALYSGVIGIITPVETKPGVWDGTPEEIPVKGNVTVDKVSGNDGDKVNTDFTLQNKVSIMAPRSLWSKHEQIRYCTLHGVKWKVTSVTLQYPRMELILGGVWNNG